MDCFAIRNSHNPVLVVAEAAHACACASGTFAMIMTKCRLALVKFGATVTACVTPAVATYLVFG
jgi:hypothetical protein